MNQKTRCETENEQMARLQEISDLFWGGRALTCVVVFHDGKSVRKQGPSLVLWMVQGFILRKRFKLMPFLKGKLSKNLFGWKGESFFQTQRGMTDLIVHPIQLLCQKIYFQDMWRQNSEIKQEPSLVCDYMVLTRGKPRPCWERSTIQKWCTQWLNL